MPPSYARCARRQGSTSRLVPSSKYSIGCLASDGRVRFHYVLIDFLCRPAASASGPRSASTSSTAPIASASDADAAEWVDVKDLAAYRVADATVRVIRKAFDRSRAGSWAPLGGYQKGE